MDPKHIIKLQGKEFVTYEGLLNEAHSQGLKSVRTRLIQVPDASNGNTAIVSAEIEMEGGKVFSGLGDASPANVNSMIARHIIRMAETRSKARAMRDATNIGMAAVEELGGDDNEDTPASRPAPARLATPAQINKVAAEMARAGWTEAQGRDHLLKIYNKKSRAELSTTEISGLIDYLVSLPSKESA